MLHRERLTVGRGGWLFALLLVVTFGAVLIPVDPLLAVAGGLVAAVVVGVALVRSAPVVEVTTSTLRAGGAAVPVHLLGAVQPLDVQETRTALGPGLDARAHVCLRGWIPTVVRADLDDPADPTPYWLVSTRSPEALAAALVRAGAAGGSRR
ncbi:hypothetical protein Cma02nite_25380 [Cellulomonas marina]|uniref:DUF3093 domain-containing protein n=1 Tax=Cellulomonas marina TaxID=988821 RepID=A0A1I0W288_9CELL|nr:hypothetical protein Cma02nite_25380 [Cellulomonas marina]SFA82654.1 Protein of unknown function [Cellulomonas marina]